MIDQEIYEIKKMLIEIHQEICKKKPLKPKESEITEKDMQEAMGE
jgi:hypothetical protein